MDRETRGGCRGVDRGVNGADRGEQEGGRGQEGSWKRGKDRKGWMRKWKMESDLGDLVSRDLAHFRFKHITQRGLGDYLASRSGPSGRACRATSHKCRFVMRRSPASVNSNHLLPLHRVALVALVVLVRFSAHRPPSTVDRESALWSPGHRPLAAGQCW